MTAEECLAPSPFATVSSRCHARNAQAGTAGPGMLPSAARLAHRILNLRSPGPGISRPERFFTRLERRQQPASKMTGGPRLAGDATSGPNARLQEAAQQTLSHGQT